MGGARGPKAMRAVGSKLGRKVVKPPPVKKVAEPVAEVKMEPVQDVKGKQTKASLLSEDENISRTVLGG
tara:strand:+ start:118 stop:324 length:207 start_codon:yes stop_codon:yes gene_type:complete